MKRIYEPAAYGPQGACWWADTVTAPEFPVLDGAQTADVAIIGAGFTGLNAAIGLAEAGQKVVVLDAQYPGYGASGRNGGFCCLGGGMAPDRVLARLGDPQAWYDTERAAVTHVDQLLDRFGLDVDRHSVGETLLAHKPSKWDMLRQEADETFETYGVEPTLIPADEMAAQGLGGPWHGALTVPLGFALNPRKYHLGLVRAAQDKGALLFAQSPARSLSRTGSLGWQIDTPRGQVTARKVIIATNGYSSDDLPDWLRARYLPLQSSVIVTRPLSRQDRRAAGWWSSQMAYDTRALLHYFRLLPDGRFLFGMRGGLRATPASQRRISKKIRKDFNDLFPAWRDIEITHEWDGLVCLTGSLLPFVGPVPGADGLYAGLGFHGNGVAMGSYAGALLAAQITGQTPPGPHPDMIQQQPARFPLGRYRRMLLAPAYAANALFDL